MHQIVDTLDGHSKLYWDALVKLRDCFYWVHSDDEGALLRALKDGTFSRTGEKLSDLQIRELRHSKRWKQRYSQYLRKFILDGTTISYRLSCWVQEFENAEDASGRSIFTCNTKKVALEQLKKVEFASDPADAKM